MAVRDENGNWTTEALEFDREVSNALKPILKSWLDTTLTLEDMFYIISNEVNSFIIDESLGW